MRCADDWNDYELIDCSDGEKLERWGNIILIRPDPQVIWHSAKSNALWKNAHARYQRSKTGGGSWDIYHKSLPAAWEINYKDLCFGVKTMGFKHTGIFPEQAVNWDELSKIIQNAGRPVKVLNLFGYTGCATIACLKAGASVCHVDASKGMVQWAKENAKLSGVADKPVRWIVDDCFKFVKREIRRGNTYDIIIMDPPSYGRGPNKEIWKLEDSIFDFCLSCAQLLNKNSLALFLNSYSTGLSSSVMEYVLSASVGTALGGRVESDEIGLRVRDTGLVLPCGATAIWRKE
ncbi:MAG: class I SAM-dependent methyltransferase [Clostridia bacterium]|nr:class I SAM-dependent methyltransferase [Clostridia bacterium]